MRKKPAPLSVFSDMSQAVLLWKHLCFTPFVERGWEGGFSLWPRREGGDVWLGKWLCKHGGVQGLCFRDDSEAMGQVHSGCRSFHPAGFFFPQPPHSILVPEPVGIVSGCGGGAATMVLSRAGHCYQVTTATQSNCGSTRQ